MISREFLLSIPKTDVHLHLDGSLRLSTLIELAQEYQVKLPSYTEEGLRETVFKDKYASLEEYLAGFAFTTAVMQSEAALERVAYELAIDNQNEGVRYIEVRFAPQLHQHKHMNAINVLKSINKGFLRAKREFNSRSEVVSHLEPQFEYGIIVCAMRMFARGFSEYFDDLLSVHAHSDPRQVFGLASQELVRASVYARDEFDIPVVGFDLAGAENGYPADDHKEAYNIAHKNFLQKTVHAGEAYGPESIFQAITDCHADRIGHGFYLFNPDKITDLSIQDREGYIADLSGYIADRRITIEVCLTSNMQTNPELKSISEHTFQKMRKAKLSVTFCTDNRLVSNTTVTEELEKAVAAFAISPRELKNYVIYGFKRSFFPRTYLEKREYVRSIIDYYEAMEKKFGLPEAV